MTKNFGTGVSGWLDPEGRNWETGVYQASKPVLDKELNLTQDVAQNERRRLGKRSLPSGWLMSDFLDTSDMTSAIFTQSAISNDLEIPQDLYAVVNGWLIRVGYTNAAGATKNRVDLGVVPSGAGAKRTDLVVLEVWRKLLSAAPDTDGKSPAGRIWWFGNVKIDSADDLTLNFADDIQDGALGSETTKRVQIQYRLRVIQGVDLFAYPMGIDDPIVVANSVPASAAAPDGVATTFFYTNQSTAGDPGLWVAGDGVPTNALGTVDGYMYAVPLMAVVRRNDTAFNRLSNHNGGVPSPGPSDRPDGYFNDIVISRDVVDLRNGVSPEGWNYREVAEKNLQFLFDNALRTEMTRTLIGGGVDGTTFLWADEVGVPPVSGDGTTTGDTPGAENIGNFDGVRRRFSDRVINEVICLAYTPSGATWVDNETVTIDPSALPVYPYSAYNWASYAPSDISFVDIVGAKYSGASGQKDLGVQVLGYTYVATGLGAVPQGSVSLDIGRVPAGVTNETLYIYLEVSYPGGKGLTKTPTADFGSSTFSVNNPGSLPADYSADEYADLYWANREMELTYRTTQVTFSFTSDGSQNEISMPERVAVLVSVKVNGTPYGGSMTLSSSGFIISDDASSAFGSAPGDTILVEYHAVRPYPQNGEQVTVYYEARAPLTVPDSFLGTSLTVVPRYIAPYLYVLTAGSGAQIEAYPFPYQYVAAAVYPKSGGTFSGDHELDGASTVYVSNFSSDTGFMKLETKIPMVPSPEKLVFNRDPGDVDIEGRSYFKSVPTTEYIPNSYAQPLSDPKKHKVIQPVLAELSADTSYGSKGELVLILVSRWAAFDDVNAVGFVSDLAENQTSASVYRLKGNLLNNRRS